MSSKVEIISLSVGQLQTNCYIVFDKGNKKALIIDPGDDADFIQRKISDVRLLPVGICATHGHFDHIMGVTELRLAYQIPFYMCPKDIFLLQNLQSSVKYFLHIESDPILPPDKLLHEGSVIKVGSISFSILETPGHTPGSISLYSPSQKILFVGDLMFENGSIGRTDFSYGDYSKLIKSLHKILDHPAGTRVYSGHGGVSTVAKERQFHHNLGF
ncbi:MAG: MBL fold metallo-hydrolase [Bacteroidetes bacterium]|nr:MAG: MBL fold metallo-hydrolase [Bacteroidota bacterium]